MLRGLFSPLGQAFLLGGCGFLAGYLFPLWRMPYSNQGPLIGIFLSGPLGVIAGLALALLGRSNMLGHGATSSLTRATS